MGIITERIEHPELGVVIETVEQEAGEEREDGEFISIEIDHLEKYSSDELIDLARWLIRQGARIRWEYYLNGAKKLGFK